MSVVCYQSQPGSIITISGTDQQCVAFSTNPHNPCPLSNHMTWGGGAHTHARTHTLKRASTLLCYGTVLTPPIPASL